MDRVRDTSSKVRKQVLELLLSILKMYLLLFEEASCFKSREAMAAERARLVAEAEEERKHLAETEDAMSKTEDGELFEDLERQVNKLKLRLKEKGQLLERTDLYLDMLLAVCDLIPTLCSLLGSRAESDIAQAMQVLQFLYLRGIAEAEAGLMKGLMLIFSIEKKVKEMVIATFHGLFVQDQPP